MKITDALPGVIASHVKKGGELAGLFILVCSDMGRQSGIDMGGLAICQDGFYPKHFDPSIDGYESREIWRP